jgi:diguanylate cyclase (GGDEF)-like protein
MLVVLCVTLLLVGMAQYVAVDAILRSPEHLPGEVARLRWLLAGTLAAGLPVGVAVLCLLGAHRPATRPGPADPATDRLTGLRNQREFRDELHRCTELARRHGRSLTLAVVDLDGFATVNATYGHRIGDRVLARLGAILRDGRPEDLPFRTGGDEFAVLLPETDIAGGRVVAERIREQVAAHPDGVTASIGLATLTVHAPDEDALVRYADAALHQAKTQGRNQVATARADTPPPRLAP